MLDVLVDPLFWVFVIGGTFLGYVLGAIPGFNAGNVMVLLLPFTLILDPVYVLIFFGAIYGSSECSGSWPAIIINVPGTPSAAAVALDGYPMSQQGRGDEALGLSAIASALGGAVGAIAMLTLTQIIGGYALAFGPREMFAIIVLALSFMVSLGAGSFFLSTVSVGLGLAFATIGVGPMTGAPRGTVGFFELYDGVPLLPLLLGVFGFSEAILLLLNREAIVQRLPKDFGKPRRTLEGMRSIGRHVKVVLMSSPLGVLIGFVPGLGASIASFISYSQARRYLDPERTFGKGNPAGVVAADAASNSAVGGALIPVFALGIPGSPATAILASALLLQGVTLGPAFLAANSEVVGIVAISILAAAPFIVLFALLLSGTFARIALLPKGVLVPIIVLASLVGGFSERQNLFDMGLVVVFGVLGVVFGLFGVSRPLFVLAFILGSLLERYLLQSLSIGQGSITYFFASPLAAVVLAATAVVLVLPPLLGWIVQSRSVKVRRNAGD